MTEEQSGKCQVEMYAGALCGRPLYDGEKCVCHSEKEDRLEEFSAEVVTVLANSDTESFDFTGFVFPDGFDLVPEYEKPVYFDKAVFLGRADFHRAEFSREASFVEAEFRGRAQFQCAKLLGGGDFTRTTFHSYADFRNADFGEMRGKQSNMTRTMFVLATFKEDAGFSAAAFYGTVIFLKSTFKGEASFLSARVEGDMSFRNCVFDSVAEFDGTAIERDASLIFDGWTKNQEPEVMFWAEAGFTGLRFHQLKQLRFRKVDLKNCRFLETDLAEVEFVDVKWSKIIRWPGNWLGRVPLMMRFMRRRNWCWRLAVGDETLEPDRWPQRSAHPKADHRSNVQYVLIANLYKQLQRNYIADYSYGESGQFYQGEQEMIRLAKQKLWQYIGVNNAYRLISHYGESYRLPLFWLGLTLLLFPVYLLVDGITLVAGNPATNYNFSWAGDFIFITADYCNVFWKNLSFVTFNRGNIAMHLSAPYQQGIVTLESIWVIVLVTFFVLALRRRFRRKSF